jgi:hypothetical protein
MSDEPLLSMLRGGRGPEVATLEEYFAKEGQKAWNRLNDIARGSAGSVGDDMIEWASRRMAETPGSFFYLLLTLAAKDKERRDKMIALYRRLMHDHMGAALHCAGYNLHEYHYLLDPEWLETARVQFDHNPEGAWGILESAAIYEPHLVLPAHIDAFEARRAAMPKDYFVTMLSLAAHRSAEAAGLLERVVRHFSEYPADAIEGTAAAARSEAPLLVPELVAAMLRHFDAKPDKAWEFFEGAVRARAEIFDDALLDALTARTSKEPGTLFTILRRLIEVEPGRTAPLMDRFVALVRRHPEKGIDASRYAFQRDDLRLVRPDLVKAICDGFAANAYPAYEILRRCAEDRPELIGTPELEAAIRNIGHATNYAFGFFRELLKLRPEFTRECTLALFECLALEPVNRAFVRAEEMGSIIAVSEAAHIKTGLENALREPPRVGSRRARALMAIMFRQKLRARRHVLLEALRYAAEVVLWRKIPGVESEKFSPIWEFLFFIIDHAADDAVSTAAAERFLEGAFQLRYLCRTGYEHDEFLRKLDLGHPARRPFPSAAAFLDADGELSELYSLVMELAKRFDVEPRLAPLEKFAGRPGAARAELDAIGRELAAAEGTRRRWLEERQRNLRMQLDCWSDPGYARALADADAEKSLSEEARALLRRERKDLAKHLRDALRAEAIRIALVAVDRSRMELYRHRVREVLGHDVDIDKVEPKILPSFLWIQAVGQMRGNAKYLKLLIEDRIAGRPHDWLRTEPPVLKWAERVKAARPGVLLERWRAPFSKEIQYRPKDALAEKRRRIKADLSQARTLLEKAGAKGIASEAAEELAARFEELRHPPQEKEGEEKRPPADPALLQEISMNLERVRLAQQTPDSDFEGRISLTVESDPFEILFMGEYGFASCLSLRGSNAWSAVSNAIDIDKTIVWAREPGGNVVGRRLLALMPEGVVMFRTYTNRHGLALDRAFDEFVAEYAEHCGTTVAHGGHPGPLLSDRWYDDGAI